MDLNHSFSGYQNMVPMMEAKIDYAGMQFNNDDAESKSSESSFISGSVTVQLFSYFRINVCFNMS
jgi:hypothetical protein